MKLEGANLDDFYQAGLDESFKYADANSDKRLSIVRKISVGSLRGFD